MYNDKYIKAKNNLYNAKLNIRFHGNKIPEENDCYACFLVLSLSSVVKVSKKYYPQILSEKWKYAVKKKNIINSINKELNLDESDEFDEENIES